MRQGMAPELYEELPYPHYYLTIWIQCRKEGKAAGGRIIHPLPGLWLDQDADLDLAFQVLDEVQEAREEADIAREHLKELAAEQAFTA